MSGLLVRVPIHAANTQLVLLNQPDEKVESRCGSLPPPLAGTMLTWARLSLCGQVTGSLSHSHHFTPKYPLSANPGQSKAMTLKRGTFADGAPPREKPRSS